MAIAGFLLRSRAWLHSPGQAIDKITVLAMDAPESKVLFTCLEKIAGDMIAGSFALANRRAR